MRTVETRLETPDGKDEHSPAFPPRNSLMTSSNSSMNSTFSLGSQLHPAKSESWQPHWSPHRILLAKVMSSNPFEYFIGVSALCNTILVAYETDLRALCGDSNSPNCAANSFTLSILNQSLLAMYTLEVVMRFYVNRSAFWNAIWNRLDVFLVLLSLVSDLVGGLLPSMSIFRLLRVVRLMKVLRVMLKFRELYLIVYGFISAMKAIFWASLLMFLLLSVWSIFAVELLHPINMQFPVDTSWSESRPFESVMQSNLTLFSLMLMGDGWSKVALPIIDSQPWTAAFFISIFATVALGFCNLILAVIVDSAAEARSEDTEYKLWMQKLNEETAKGKLMEICQSMDLDSNGLLTLKELHLGYKSNPDFVDSLKIMDIHREELDFVFMIMGGSDEGAVNYTEFVDQLYKMRAADTRTLLMFIKLHVLELRQTVLQDLEQHKIESHAMMRHASGSNQPVAFPSESDAGECVPTPSSKQSTSTRKVGRWDLPRSKSMKSCKSSRSSVSVPPASADAMSFAAPIPPADPRAMSASIALEPGDAASHLQCGGDCSAAVGAPGLRCLLSKADEHVKALAEHEERLSVLTSFLPRILGAFELRAPQSQCKCRGTPLLSTSAAKADKPLSPPKFLLPLTLDETEDVKDLDICAPLVENISAKS